MVKQLKKIAVYLVEWHMLRIYAAIMTTLFFSIWIPAMIMVFKEMIKTFWQYDTKQIKQLQNLYSWNQFYQDRKMKAEMKKCQSDIHALKLVINELKTNKK